MISTGNNWGPYKHNKLYCAYCGEYRTYGHDAASNTYCILCTECGMRVRRQGRHWTRHKEPARY